MTALVADNPAFDTQVQDEASFRIGEEQFVLVGLRGAAAALEYTLTKGTTVLGRSTDCDICLTDARVSRQHARLTLVMDPYEPTRSVVLIEDMDSRNGLRIDGAPIHSTILSGGEKIQVGDSILRLDRRDDLDATLSARLKAMATTDPLTGLGNRRSLQEALERAEAGRLADGRRYSLLVADIDFFKKVNDSFGHAAGDAVLRHVAEVAKKCLRGADAVFRFGGEEFVAVLSGADVDQARQVAERIRTAIEQSIAVHDATSIAVTLSFGVADGAPAAFDAADRALYTAKQTGRNRVACAAPIAS